jgi:heptosyltransferase-2
LATAALEQLHATKPEAEIHFLVRAGNENLVAAHPFLKKVWVWEKRNKKYKHLFKLIREVKKEHFDVVVNLQRFAATGLLTFLSGAKMKLGFSQNPFFWTYNFHLPHKMGGENPLHEVERNSQLLNLWEKFPAKKPRLYSPEKAQKKIIDYKKNMPFLCIAPASVWQTKEVPEKIWIDFLNKLPAEYTVYLLGGPDDQERCEAVAKQANFSKIINLAGKLNLLESAALMQGAAMNYVNDSAPMHLASAMNAPVCAVYCSTVPEFGFGPLSEVSHVIEVEEKLECRPCGMHGKKACPLGHFECGNHLRVEQLLEVLDRK